MLVHTVDNIYIYIYNIYFFFKDIYCTENQRNTQGYKIVPLTNLPWLSIAERVIEYLPC